MKGDLAELGSTVTHGPLLQRVFALNCALGIYHHHCAAHIQQPALIIAIMQKKTRPNHQRSMKEGSALSGYQTGGPIG